MNNWSLQDEKALLADSCRNSFSLFAQHACGVNNPENPMAGWWGPYHTKLANWLDRIGKEWEPVFREKRAEQFFIMLDAARNSAKTVIATKCFPLWLSLRNPDLAVVIDADDLKQSVEFAEFPRKILAGQDPFAPFCWLYGGSWEGSDIWTRGRFTHAARRVNRTEASFETTSVETGVTGKHPDLHAGDDYITIDKIKEKGSWITTAKIHMDGLIPALQPWAMLIYAGTPYTDGDVLTTCIRRDGIREVVGLPLPSEYAKHVRPNGKWRMFHLPARDTDGKPTLPIAWPEERLKDYQLTKPAAYACDAMLRPGSGDLVALSFEQIEELLCEPSTVPKGLVLSFHFDTAFKDPKKMGQGDDSVIEVWGHHIGTGDVYYLDGSGSNQWRDDQFIDELIRLFQKWRPKYRHVTAITDEKTIGGKEGIWRGYLRASFIKAGHYMPRFIEINRGGTKKIGRITEAASYWIDGHVHLVKTAGGLDKLMEQMARIGVSEKDDWADAGADVFHPEIYRPIQIPEGATQPPPPRRPGDDYLQTGKLTREDAEFFYDEYYGENDKYVPRPPISSESGR